MDEQLKITFSTNLKKLLADNEKSQADMAKYMKISSATASDWCNGKKIPRADKLQSLCSWLSCDLDSLMGTGSFVDEMHDKYNNSLFSWIYTDYGYEAYEAFFKFIELPPSKQDSIISYIRFLATESKLDEYMLTEEEFDFMLDYEIGVRNSSWWPATKDNAETSVEILKSIESKYEKLEKMHASKKASEKGGIDGKS